MSEENNGWKVDIQNVENIQPSYGENENIEKSFSESKMIENKPDEFSNTQFSTGSQSEQNYQNSSQEQFSKKGLINKIISKKFLLIAASVFGVFILVGGGIFAYHSYDKKYGEVAIEKILPKDSNIIIKIGIDLNGEQFSLLESNLEKFPGYDELKREMGENGEKKTISEMINGELKEKGLDFQEDIKPAINEKVYILIPDAVPLVKNLGEAVTLSLLERRNKLSLNVNEKEEVVLGSNDSKKDKSVMRADFILGSEIKDLKKAKEVLEKMKKENKYEISNKKHENYDYYELKLKEDNKKIDEKNKASNEIIGYKTTYHALLGKNWIISSNESQLKGMIDRRKKNEMFSFSEEVADSLEKDENYQKVSARMNKEEKNNLVDTYYNLNANKFFGDDLCAGDAGGCISSADEILKLPEEMVGGFSVRMEENGVELISTTNRMSMEDVKNRNKEKSLASKIPQKVGERWTDVFVENSDIKGFYYNFKNNNLSDEMIDEIDSGISEIRSEIGIDLEKDFIDIISGSGVFLGLAKKDSFPSAALAFEISETERMNSTMKKVFELIKKIQQEIYSERILAYEKTIKMYENKNSTDRVDTLFHDDINKQDIIARYRKKIEESKKILDEIGRTSIVEEDISFGKIYSQGIYLEEELPFLPKMNLSYAIENGIFYVGLDKEVIKDLISGVKEGKALSSEDSYKTATKYYENEIYASSYLATQGIANAIEYVASSIMLQFVNSVSGNIEQMSEEDKKVVEREIESVKMAYLAPLGILKTIKYVGAYNSAVDDSIKSSVFLNIVELPNEEKIKIEEAMRGVLDSVGGLSGVMNEAF